jgi:4-methyl-5(b-hydroxyethyl)-thiazole monophosphate biosynthesis
MASVLVPLAEGCEELEAITVVDLLRRAGIGVVTASLENRQVRASRGSVLVADVTLDDAVKQKYDMIVLPGGLPGADHLDQDPRIRGLLKEMSETGRYTAAICAAPRVLANAGLLEGKSATSFPGILDAIEGVNYSEEAVVQDGRLITSRGPGTAMDFALTLIENLAGKDKRDEVEAGLQRPENRG